MVDSVKVIVFNFDWNDCLMDYDLMNYDFDGL